LESEKRDSNRIWMDGQVYYDPVSSSCTVVPLREAVMKAMIFELNIGERNIYRYPGRPSLMYATRTTSLGDGPGKKTKKGSDEDTRVP